jgi:hypothetical protein
MSAPAAVDHVRARRLERTGDLHRVVGRDATFDPVMRRDPH